MTVATESSRLPSAEVVVGVVVGLLKEHAVERIADAVVRDAFLTLLPMLAEGLARAFAARTGFRAEAETVEFVDEPGT